MGMISSMHSPSIGEKGPGQGSTRHKGRVTLRHKRRDDWRGKGQLNHVEWRKAYPGWW